MRSEAGSVLLTTLVLLMTVTFMGGILVRLVHMESSATITREAQVRALYLAHAAVAQAAWELDRQRYGTLTGAELNEGVVPTLGTSRPFGGGTLRARFDERSGTVAGTGDYDGVERTIVVKLDAQS
jgi:hypothetical protein